MELKDIMFEAAAATDSVATRMGFTAQFSAVGYHPVSHSAMDTDFAQEEGAITEFVRSRDLLRAKAQETVMKMRTNARLKEMINGSLQGTRGPLEDGAEVEYRPLEQPKGAFTVRQWIGPRSAIKQETPKLVWLRFPDGAARLVRRHRARPVLRNDKIVAELKNFASGKMYGRRRSIW